MNKRAFLFELTEVPFDPEIVATAEAESALDAPARLSGWEIISATNNYTRPSIDVTCFGDTESKFVMGLERHEVTIRLRPTMVELLDVEGWPPKHFDLDEECPTLRVRGRLFVSKYRLVNLLDGGVYAEITGLVEELEIEWKPPPEPEPVAVEPLPRRAMKLGGWKETE